MRKRWDRLIRIERDCGICGVLQIADALRPEDARDGQTVRRVAVSVVHQQTDREQRRERAVPVGLQKRRLTDRTQ